MKYIVDYIKRYWRVTFYLVGIVGLVWGFFNSNTTNGLLIWLVCNMCILMPDIADVSVYAMDGDDDNDEC